MPITLRLILSLLIASSVVVFTSTGYQAAQERRRLQGDLDRRATIVSERLLETAEPLIAGGRTEELQGIFDTFVQNERLRGVALYAIDREPLVMSKGLPENFHSLPLVADVAIHSDQGKSVLIQFGKEHWHLFALPVRQDETLKRVLVVFHDADYIHAHTSQVWRENFKQLLGHVLLICLIALIIVRWSLIQPLSRTLEWVRQISRGETAQAPPKGALFGPLTREVSRIAKRLEVAKAAAEEEARLRIAAESRWTPERLKEHVRSVLQGRTMVVVANREPYVHVHKGRQIQWMVPASGLVTAVEPIMRACGGTWIAHGSGDADRETSDSQGKLKVPPDAPFYTLKRVWLSKEEEDGYYYGFANEGLWPLCHIAHTRPIFRAGDWDYYRRVNEKFAQAVLDELEGTEDPFVLIQDYHFALLPRMIKNKRPDAKIAVFWHIPWPNPEAFGICPWAGDLLDGMLGADLLGFHIQFHCNNFLDTIDRLLESRIDWEQFAINRSGHTTRVKAFPISIAEQELATPPPKEESAESLKERLVKELGITAKWIGVGVDRIDYTKGIAERFRAVERLIEKYPAYREAFTFVQIGAPSRTLIKRYHDLGAELEAEADRINRRFQTRQWKPIVFIKEHRSHKEIIPFYRAADVCLVTALHDGMNLVAKEFVASRFDGRGVLILSQFAGASRELGDALLVNPYDTEQVADAIHYAIQMKPEEQQARMTRMLMTLQERNIYRWAADLVTDLSRISSPREPEAVAAQQA